MRHLIRVDDIPLWGHRFAYENNGFEEEAILLRLTDGSIKAYKNECKHLPMKLDERDPHDIWDSSGELLTCSSHGALYRPDDGECVAGPCQGAVLEAVPIVVKDGSVYYEGP